MTTTTSTLRAHAEQAAARGELLIVDPAPVLALLARLDAIAEALRPALEAQQGATPGPWGTRFETVMESERPVIYQRRRSGGIGFYVGFLSAGSPDDVLDHSAENAALIVSAVNALPALRAALEGE